MASARVHFLDLPFLKYNQNAVFLFKIPIIRNMVSFFLKVIFFVMFGGCTYKALDKVYSKQLRSYDPAN